MAERKQQIQGSLCEALENIRVMFQKLNNFTQWKKTLTATGACLDYCCFVIQLPTMFLTAFSQTTICILIQMKLCPDTNSFERISGEIIIMFSKHIHLIHSVQTNVKSHWILTVCLRVELSWVISANSGANFLLIIHKKHYILISWNPLLERKEGIITKQTLKFYTVRWLEI